MVLGFRQHFKRAIKKVKIKQIGYKFERFKCSLIFLNLYFFSNWSTLWKIDCLQFAWVLHTSGSCPSTMTFWSKANHINFKLKSRKWTMHPALHSFNTILLNKSTKLLVYPPPRLGLMYSCCDRNVQTTSTITHTSMHYENIKWANLFYFTY